MALYLNGFKYFEITVFSIKQQYALQVVRLNIIDKGSNVQ